MVNLKNKKGVSVIVGYVILVTFGIILSVIVYNYLRTFVPNEISSCPSDVSIFLKEISCNTNQLNLTIKNNGKFNINGYYIRGGKIGENTATIDLSTNWTYGGLYILEHHAIYFKDPPTDPFKPNQELESHFNLTENYAFIELIPIRQQLKENVQQLIVCGNSKIKEILTCNQV